jgi:ABC-type phosphate transport system substrate-binding protein
MLRRNLLGTCAVTALLIGTATDSQALTVYGGGSTLAGPLYQTILGGTGFMNLVPNDTVSYALSGSGAGVRALLCNAPVQDSYPAGTDIQYGATDNPLSANQITSYNNSTNLLGSSSSNCDGSSTGNGGGTYGYSTGGPLIQFPTFGTPITVPFNLAGNTANGGITLNDAQLCAIFSGKITTWSNTGNLAGIYTPPPRGGTPPSGPITVVVRSDGSGTSALFTAHLAAVCPHVTLADGSASSNITFTSTQTFASLFGGAASLPANFKAASGSGGVKAAIGAGGGTTAGSIGYLSPDYTKAASIHGTDATYAPVSYLINHNDATKTPLPPNYVNTSTALTKAPTPAETSGTTFLPAIADPSAGYPIVGYTTFVTPQCLNDPTGAVVGAIVTFLNQLYADGNTISQIQAQGFVQLPASLVGQVTTSLINGDSKLIDIQDASVCQGGGATTPVAGIPGSPFVGQ